MKWNSRQMAGRLASVATIWGVSKALDTPAGKKTVKKVDQKVVSASSSIGNTLKQSGRNASKNKGWLAAGVATLTAGAALLGRAFRKP